MTKFTKISKKIKIILITIAIFCFLYIILALRPLSTELHLTPEWTENISHLSSAKEGDVPIPFKLGQSMGYFTEDGRIISNIAYPFKAAISSSWYASYSANSSSTDFYKNSGEKAGVIDEYGFPFFDKDRIYVFLPGGNSFVQCDAEGKRLWLYESYAPITAFSSSSKGTVAGFADGTLVSFTKDGQVDQKFQPGGSKYPIIVGVGISEDGNLIACVSGQNQQRFVIAEKNGGHSKIIFHEWLNEDSNSQELVKFNRSANTVWYGYKGGLGIVDLKKLNSYKIPLKGTVIQIEEAENSEFTYILSRENSKCTVTVLEPFNQVAASFSFTAESAFIQVNKDSLFIGRDNKISRLTVSRK